MSADLNINITAEIDGLKKGLSQAEKEINDFTKDSQKIDSLGESFSDLGETIGKDLVPELRGVGKDADSLGDTMGGLGDILADTTLSFHDLADIARNLGLNKAAEAFDLLGAGITGVGGSATTTLGTLGLLTASIGLLAVAGGALYLMFQDIGKTTDDLNPKFQKFRDVMNEATASGEAQVASLNRLYATAQDVTKSQNERNKAAEDMIRLYPQVLDGIDKETIKAGKLGDVYKKLTENILKSARAKAAQAQIDKAEEARLKEEVRIRTELQKQLDLYNNPRKGVNAMSTFGQTDMSKVIEGVKIAAKRSAYELIQELKQLNKDFNSENEFFLKAVTDNYVEQAKAIEDGADSKLKPALKKTAEVVKEGVKNIINEFDVLKIEDIRGFTSVLNGEFYKDIFDVPEVALGDQISQRLIETGQIIANRIPEVFKPIKSEWQIASEELDKQMSQILSSGISNGIGDAFYAIGETMANGGNVAKALGQSLLSTIGTILTQLGQAAISVGIGMQAIKMSFKNPFTAIAAGAALVAMGAFIKGTVANIPKGGSSGGSVSSGAGGGSSSYSSSYSSGGVGGGEYVFRINGNDLVAVLSRNQDRNTRLNTR